MTQQEAQLEKIRALLAKAEGTKFPEEARLFSAKAQELMSAKRQNFTPKLVSQNQTKPACVVWGVQTSPEYVAWCGSKGYAESFLQKVIFGQSGETAPGAAGAQMTRTAC